MTRISLRTILFLSASVIVVAILTAELDWTIQLPAILVLLGSMSYVTLALDLRQRQAKESEQLRHTCEQLDQHAKAIVRSDVELHRAQEALDRKIASLLVLHELSQGLRISLHPEDVYGQLTPSLVTSFGFSKGLAGVREPGGGVKWRALIGMTDAQAREIRDHLLASGWLEQLLTNPSPRTVTTAQSRDPSVVQLLELFASRCLVLAGIKPSTGPAGCLLLARDDVGTSAVQGDEELVGILTRQLAIAIEGCSLYEEAWNARQSLERSVQERTQELEEANHQLTRLNKAKSDFVSAVSHELRTPLAAIKGYASLLRSGQFGPLQPAQTERMAKVEKHSDLLTDLINNLLDIARIESGRVTMDCRPVVVKELLASLVDLFKPQLDAKHLTLAMDADGVEHLLGDPQHLPRVFMNLLSNAVKYTPAGGTITVSMSRHNGRVTTAIRDTGTGIDAVELPKLFQEFYRAAHPVNEQVQGTGLGLALVKRIVEAHHGTIGVESTVGRGTTFAFTLPDPPPTPASS